MATAHGFARYRAHTIPELHSTAALWRHLSTGAELLRLANDDDNNVFGITFRTPPADSTGVAHVLEHAVLSGSRKYPLKEPFAELSKGSLHTFLNAMTFPDKTCYPVASRNRQDFYNLIDVYLDAVLHPLLREQTFEEQGWHYACARHEEPLRVQGVVFNEMQGAYTSPDRVLADYIKQSLFPGHPYGYASGGHPRHIPDLTYAQFTAFHQRYYHPANARLFLYGNDRSDTALRLIDAALTACAPHAMDATIPPLPRLTQPQRFIHPYAASQAAETPPKGMLAVSWLFEAVPDPETALALHLLAELLIGTPASPLRKALIDSKLGENLVDGGIEDLRQPYFSTGLKGIDVADADTIEKLILDTLNGLAHAGIDPALVTAAINTMAFRRRENNTGPYPRGLSLMLRALSTWLYDGDPLEPLAFDAPLAAISARVAAHEPFFETLISRYLLDNPHRTTVILTPDTQIRQREEAAETARLTQVRTAMGPAALDAIIAKGYERQRRQEIPDPPEIVATVPRLSLTALEPQNTLIPLTHLTQHKVPILYHDLPTNEIVYLDLGFNLHILPQDTLPYVPLFGRALLEMGTATADFAALAQRIGAHTGGMHTMTFSAACRNTPEAAAWLFLRSKATVDQAAAMLAIIREVLLTVQLDNPERFRQLVLEEKAQQEARVAPMGHLVVNARLRAPFTEADWATEQMGGVSYLGFLRHLADRLPTDWPQILARLEHLRSVLIHRHALLCNVTLDAANWLYVAPQLAESLAMLPNTAAPPDLATWDRSMDMACEGLVIPAAVNYVGKGANLYQNGYQLHGAAAVVTHYLQAGWLWDRVRVQGGAYGCLSRFDHHSGVFSYLSYRDPQVWATLDTYDQSSQHLRQVALDDDALTKAILGAIRNLDPYQLPDAKGYTAMTRYLTGDTDARRQRLRDDILATTAADFRAFADVLEHVREHGRVVVLGSRDVIEAANAKRPGWLNVIEVL